MLRIIFIILLGAGIIKSIAQVQYITKIPALENLPVNAIHRIYQDSEGYMWYGTVNGLCRDDGYRIQTFRSDFHTPGVLKDNLIAAIAEDKKGRIWFSTNCGTYVLNKTNYRITEINHPLTQGHRTGHIFSTRDSSIWIGVKGNLLRFDSQLNCRQYPLTAQGKPSELNGFCEDRQGNILITVKHGDVYLYNKEKDSFIAITKGLQLNPSMIGQDKEQDYYWLCTWNEGLVKLTLKKNKAYIETSERVSKDARSVISFVQKDNKLWCTSDRSLYSYTIHNNRATLDTTSVLEQYPAMLNEVVLDNRGDLWVSAFDRPSFIVHIAEDAPTYYALPTLQAQCGYQPAIMALCPTDSDSNVFWMFQEREGVFLYDIKEQTAVSHHLFSDTRTLPFDLVKIMEKGQEKNSVWICPEYKQQVYKLSHKAFSMRLDQFVDFKDLIGDDAITCIYEDTNNKLWIGTDHGLLCHDLKKQTTTRIKNIKNYISAICRNNQGTLFVATRCGGIYAIDPDKHIKRYNMPQPFNCIAYAINGFIWLGSDEGELFSLSPHNGKIVNHTKVCNMNGNMINRILTDDYNHIWISFNQKIIEYNPENRSYRTYDTTDDNVNIWRIIPTAACHANNGSLYFGGIPGIMRLTPSNSLNKEATPAEVRITDVLIDEKSLFFSLHRPIQKNEPLKLKAEDKNVIIYFSSLHHLSAHKIRYSYHLEGFEKEWHEASGSTPCAIYQNLPKGKYTLYIKATDDKGCWGHPTTCLEITKQPACYETWWAFLLYALTATTITVSGVVYYIHRSIKRNNTLWKESQELLRMRNYITDKLDEQCEETENLNRVFVNNARHIIETNLSNPELNVDWLASQMNFSRPTFTRKIKNITGKTPLEFIHQIKMIYAKKLLTNKDRSISEVAMALGFSDRKHFTSCFKKEFGIPPTIYQKQHQEEKNDLPILS
jgi:two-component system response regulator